MKALVITRPGGPGVLEIRELPDPEPGPEEVLVRVRASALNRADLLQRRGRYPAPPGAPPDVPGLEFAGEVERCGERVASLRSGDRVMGIVGGGGHAEKLILHERMCLPVPASFSWEEAAAVPEAFLTAYDAMFLRGGLVPGETVLVDAAASGVGTAAVQIAAATGCRPIALSRSADKRRRLAALGAEHVLDPAESGLADRIRLVAEGGLDLAVDLVGASAWPVLLQALAECGRLVLVGTMSGSQVETDLSILMRKRLTVVGTVLRGRPLEEKLDLTRRFARTMLPLLASGRLRPVLDRAVPIEDAAAAHAAMERNENFGKIVLRVG
jgi:NADPH:quinone reductase